MAATSSSVFTSASGPRFSGAPNLFVPTDASPVQVQVHADGAVIPKTLPIPNWGGVSPDGHWIWYFETSTDPAQVGFNMLWDLSTGVGRLAGGSAQTGMPGWSPASELVQCESGGFTCDLVAPETGIVLRQFSFPALGYPPVSGDLDFHWGTNDEPVLLAAPVLWLPQQTVRAPNPVGAVESELDFGLLLRDLGSNSDPVQVLPPEAGLTIYGTSTAGTALVWARKCQGLYETVCSYYLHRITLPGGANQIVAVGDSAAPVAISVSGHRFAIAALDGIHRRTALRPATASPTSSESGPGAECVEEPPCAREDVRGGRPRQWYEAGARTSTDDAGVTLRGLAQTIDAWMVRFSVLSQQCRPS